MEESRVKEEQLEQQAPEPVVQSAEKQQQTTEQWLADPVNRQRTLLLAKQIQNVCGKGWFNLKAACKRSGEGREAVFAKISICGQFGFMAKQERERETLYKVALTHEDHVQVLRFFAAQHEGQIKMLYHEIKKLQTLIQRESEASVKS